MRDLEEAWFIFRRATQSWLSRSFIELLRGESTYQIELWAATQEEAQIGTPKFPTFSVIVLNFDFYHFGFEINFPIFLNQMRPKHFGNQLGSISNDQRITTVDTTRINPISRFVQIQPK